MHKQICLNKSDFANEKNCYRNVDLIHNIGNSGY